MISLNIIDSDDYVYMLRSLNPKYPNRTYIGYTNNLKRRIRQHNGLIKGGAKYTRVGRPYKIVCYISGFPNRSSALQFEWRCHHPGGKGKNHRRITNRYRKYKGLDRRKRILEFIFKLERWTNNCHLCKSFQLTINWLESCHKIKKLSKPHRQQNIQDEINTIK